MKRFRVQFLPDERSVEVEEGRSILEAAQEAEVFITNLCGGEGVCGQCRVQILQGDVRMGEEGQAFFSEEELKKGFVLACQSPVEDDLEVYVLPESRMEEAQILTGGEEEETQGEPPAPLVRKLYLELPPPTLQDNVSDSERIVRALRKMVGWRHFETPLSCLQGISETLRSSEWKATAALARDENRYRILTLEAGDTSKAYYGLAVDVGTTTVVVQLLDIASRTVLGVEGSHNLQASYGEDVISRMIYACDKGGLPVLHEAVVKNINQLIERLTAQRGISAQEIYAVVAAGNTTMSHLLLNLVPCSIRLEPYVPTTDRFPQILAREIGIQIHPQGILETVPCVASYVGGDIVAGVMACGIPKRDEVQALIDIGTNGEIALGNKDWLVCCSASAGPAFEGGGTRCGMRAIRGAIEKIEIQDGKVKYRTIGNAKPRGICGSGLIDCIHELVKNRIIGADGRFDRNLDDPRLTFEEGIPQYTLAYPEETEGGGPIVITESDIDNLLKSKGAVFAAIKSLVDYVGIPFDQIESFSVAGGFGSYLDISKAVAIGLLPDIPRDKIHFIGNSSLSGARLCLLSEAAFEQCINIARSMTNIELSAYQPFMDEYVAALFLPHTDRKLFPSVTY